jgi:hypothetical protein
MTENEFESVLSAICDKLKLEALDKPFGSASDFEIRVREVADEIFGPGKIDFSPPAQAFPDIAIDQYGIEVKFTTNDTWRSVANSVLESNRVDGIEKIYIVFGKMGGSSDVRWAKYEDCVMHVRTSHVPRFEVEIGAVHSLFEQMGVSYEVFRSLNIHEKMEYIRSYARSRLKVGERLWWLEDSPEEEHTLPIQARLYTSLSTEEKKRLRAQAVLLCPRIVSSGRSRNKYDDVVLLLLTYHGVLCHQARDLFSAGSVANPKNDDAGGLYIERAISLIEPEIRIAASEIEDDLLMEYWGYSVPQKDRIREWLRQADGYATDWRPSDVLFRDLK